MSDWPEGTQVTRDSNSDWWHISIPPNHIASVSKAFLVDHNITIEQYMKAALTLHGWRTE